MSGISANTPAADEVESLIAEANQTLVSIRQGLETAPGNRIGSLSLSRGSRASVNNSTADRALNNSHLTSASLLTSSLLSSLPIAGLSLLPSWPLGPSLRDNSLLNAYFASTFPMTSPMFTGLLSGSITGSNALARMALGNQRVPSPSNPRIRAEFERINAALHATGANSTQCLNRQTGAPVREQAASPVNAVSRNDVINQDDVDQDDVDQDEALNNGFAENNDEDSPQSPYHDSSVEIVDLTLTRRAAEPRAHRRQRRRTSRSEVVVLDHDVNLPHRSRTLQVVADVIDLCSPQNDARQIRRASRNAQPNHSSNIPRDLSTRTALFASRPIEETTPAATSRVNAGAKPNTNKNSHPDPSSTSTTTSSSGRDFMCAICMESPLDRDPNSTKCGHVFCKECILKAIQVTHKCPICNKRLNSTQLIRLYV